MNITFYLKLSTIFFARQNLRSMPSMQTSFGANRLLSCQVAQKAFGLFDCFECQKEGMFLKRQIKGFQVGLHGSTKSFLLRFKPFYKNFSNSKMGWGVYKKPIVLSEKTKSSGHEQRSRSLMSSLSTIFQAMQVVQAWLNEPKHKISDASKSVEHPYKKAERNGQNKQIICEQLNIITENIIATRVESIKKLLERMDVNNSQGENKVEFLEKIDIELDRVMNKPLKDYATVSDEDKWVSMLRDNQEFVPDEAESVFIINSYHDFIQKAKYFCFLPNQENQKTCVFLHEKNKDFYSDVFLKSVYFQDRGFDYFKKDTSQRENDVVELYTIESMLEIITELKKRVLFCPLSQFSKMMGLADEVFQWEPIALSDAVKHRADRKNFKEEILEIFGRFDAQIKDIVRMGNFDGKNLFYFFRHQTGYVFKKTTDLLKTLFKTYSLLRSFRSFLSEPDQKLEKNKNDPYRFWLHQKSSCSEMSDAERLEELLQYQYQRANDFLVGFIKGYSNIKKFVVFYIKFLETFAKERIDLHHDHQRKIKRLCTGSPFLKTIIIPFSSLSRREQELFSRNLELERGIRGWLTEEDESLGRFNPSGWLVWQEEDVSKDRKNHNPDQIYDLLTFPKLKPSLFKSFFDKYEGLDYDSQFEINDLYT